MRTAKKLVADFFDFKEEAYDTFDDIVVPNDAFIGLIKKAQQEVLTELLDRVFDVPTRAVIFKLSYEVEDINEQVKPDSVVSSN